MNKKNNPDQQRQRDNGATQSQPNQSETPRREVQPPGEQSDERKNEQREERKRLEQEKSDERRP